MQNSNLTAIIIIEKCIALYMKNSNLLQLFHCLHILMPLCLMLVCSAIDFCQLLKQALVCIKIHLLHGFHCLLVLMPLCVMFFCVVLDLCLVIFYIMLFVSILCLLVIDS